MSTYGVAPRVSVSNIPLYRHLGQAAPGATISAVGKTGGAVAGTVVTGELTSAASSGAISGAWGAAAGPIGAAVAVGIGLIAGLLAAHAQRAAEAKNENQAVNLGVSGFDQGLQQIQQAFNSGAEDAPTCAQAAALLLTNYWAEVAPHIQPGRNGCAGGASCPGQNIPANYCSGNIGAACCVGCESLERSINGPDGVLAALGGTSTSKNGPTAADIYQVFSSQYGTTGRSGYTVTFTPPAGGAGGVTSALTSLTGGGSSGLLLLLALGAGAFFLLR